MLPEGEMEIMDVRGVEDDLEKGLKINAGKSQLYPTDSMHSLRRLRHLKSVAWMGLLSDDTPLTMLTIPGTHDSAAYTSSVPFISTQKMDFLDQLNEGIRYFDLRCGIRRDIVEMVHGVSYLGMTLLEVLATMYLWLSLNPSEALIVQIKQDRGSDHSNLDFDDAVVALLSQRSERWRFANDVPVLGEIRGRIQLFRRFGTMNAYGLDVTEWKDNPPNPFTIIRGRGIRVTIQDRYTFPRPQPLPSVIKRKGGAVSKQMRLAAANRDPNHWFINFTSAYELNLQYQLTPRSIAVGAYHRFTWIDGVNVLLRGSLLEYRGKRTRLGIVAMDFPEIGTDDLIAALIQSNFDLEEENWWCFKRGLIMLVLLVGLLMLGFRVETVNGQLLLWTTRNFNMLLTAFAGSILTSPIDAHPP